MSFEKKFEEVKQRFGFDPQNLIGKEIEKYTIDRYVGHGTMGVVFHAIRKDIGDEAACKIIPKNRLQPGWQTELVKLAKLTDIPQVVQYKTHGPEIIEDVPQVCILISSYMERTFENMRENVRN